MDYFLWVSPWNLVGVAAAGCPSALFRGKIWLSTALVSRLLTVVGFSPLWVHQFPEGCFWRAVVGASLCWGCSVLIHGAQWGFSPGVTIALLWVWVLHCSLFPPCKNMNYYRGFCWISLTHCYKSSPKYFLGLMFPRSMAVNVFLTALIS